MHQHNVMNLQSICHRQTDWTLLRIAQCHSVRIFRKINSGSTSLINMMDNAWVSGIKMFH